MTKEKLNKIGNLTAAITFLIASFIMFAHYMGFKGDYGRYGLTFIPIALVLNVCIVIFIFYSAKRHDTKGPFYSILIMLLNIPVAFFYLWFAIFLMGYYRITIINDTKSTITNVNLSGCDNKAIQKLDAGEKVTVWIGLDNDCSLKINYLDNTKTVKKDIIAGYLCSGMGQPENYHINGRNNPKY